MIIKTDWHKTIAKIDKMPASVEKTVSYASATGEICWALSQ